MSQKQKIAILFGGCSSEYGVSLQSAYSVITHLDPGQYEPVLIGITQSGEWFRFLGDPEKIKDNAWHNPDDCVRAIISPSRDIHGLLEFHAEGYRTTQLDAALPVLHGKNGEDGTVQGLLELAGIPIVGCNTMCSALCMDKHKAHKIVSLAGIRVPRSFLVTHHVHETDSGIIFSQADEIGYPLFVKPVKAGSSLGISKVFEKSELLPAIKLAFSHDNEVIVEGAIPGLEIGCAIWGEKDDLIVGELDEIEVTEGFFDFNEKYSLKNSTIHVPARIPRQKSDEIKHEAKRIYQALGCSGFARIDMFLTPDGQVVFSEANTIPGFTVKSQYPKMMNAIGMTLDQIITKSIEMAIKS